MLWFNVKCRSTVRLDEKTAVVTGSNAGIGKETARDFFIRGCRVLMLCRNLDKAKEAAEDIKRDCQGMEGVGELIVQKLDLSSLASIKSCAEAINRSEDRINILVNNAGVFVCPFSRTEDGFEMQFGTNHLGHFYLTLLLLPKIINSAPARIVNISSVAHTRCRVLMLCRNLDKAKEAAEDIKRDCQGMEGVGELIVQKLDLSSLASIKSCAEAINRSEDRINILVNNAGVFVCPFSRTEDGFEMQFGTNHLGHFYLTLLLLPKIINSAPARIVNISSVAHTRGHIDFDDLNWEKRSYSALEAYSQSKLANILFTKELAKRLQEANISNVTVYSLHPGIINTEAGRHLDNTYFRGLHFLCRIVLSPIMKTPRQGAQTTIYCSVEEKTAKDTGLYYSHCKVKEPSVNAKNMDDARKLWDISVKLVKLDDNYNPFGLRYH